VVITLAAATRTLGQTVSGVDITSGDYATTPLVVGGATFDMKDTLLNASGQVAISIGKFFYLSGAVTFQRSTIADVRLAGATSGQAMTAMTISASGVDAFAGINGPASNPQALGIKLTNVNYGLALLSPDSTTTTSS